VGGFTNVQDHSVISTVSSLESGFPAKVEIGNYVTIGGWVRLVDGGMQWIEEPTTAASPLTITTQREGCLA